MGTGRYHVAYILRTFVLGSSWDMQEKEFIQITLWYTTHHHWETEKNDQRFLAQITSETDGRKDRLHLHSLGGGDSYNGGKINDK